VTSGRSPLVPHACAVLAADRPAGRPRRIKLNNKGFGSESHQGSIHCKSPNFKSGTWYAVEQT
jgi:hypothetical protein